MTKTIEETIEAVEALRPGIEAIPDEDPNKALAVETHRHALETLRDIQANQGEVDKP